MEAEIILRGNINELIVCKKAYREITDIRRGNTIFRMLMYSTEGNDISNLKEYIGKLGGEVFTLSTTNNEKVNRYNIDVVLILDLETEFEFSISQIDHLKNYAFKTIKTILALKFDRMPKFVLGFKNRTCFEAMNGLLKTIQLENSEFVYKSVFSDESDEKKWIERIFYECTENDFVNKDIAYRNGVRTAGEVCRVDYKSDDANNTIVRDGTYLITGGAGGLGLFLALHLKKQGAKNVVLVGRRSISGVTESRRKFIDNKVIKYFSCDITEERACEQMISDMIMKYGGIDGVYHCAGVLNDSLANTLTYDKFSECIEIKVQGIINIMDTLVKYSSLNTFVKIFSSTTSVLGNAGQSAYSFANGLVNMLVNGDSKYSVFAIQSICWPLWENGGMSLFKDKIDNVFELTGQKILTEEMGMKVLDMVDGRDESCPIVLVGDENRIMKYLKSMFSYNSQKNIENIVVNNASVSINDVEKIIFDVVSETVKIQKERIDIYAHWESYGIDSIAIMQMNEKLKKIIPEISVAIFYECTSVKALVNLVYNKYNKSLAGYLNKSSKDCVQKTQEIQESGVNNSVTLVDMGLNQRKNKNRFIVPTKKNEDIAIIGIAGRYPMAENLEEFWNNLTMGKDCIEEIPKERWDCEEYYDSKKGKKGYTNSKWGGFLRNYNCFDAQFFHMTPREARYIDPQERIFLECSWHALEDAGYTTKMLQEQSVGVYVGVMYSHYQLYGLDYIEPSTRRAFNSSYSSIANRVSFYFNLHGPSMAIDTMCSSSLTAMHLARESILNGECEVAIAGGVNLSLHPNKYINLSQSNFLSSDGKCRSFGEGGDGYVPSEGVGAVILKKLELAKKNGDYIYGIIKATAINHGGHANGFTVPNLASQTEVIKRAMKVAEVKPEQYAYIETHGTGTPLGDPIELNAMQNAFGGMRDACPIGSVKSNIGHCEAASGVAGLTKVLLQMKKGVLVPSIHYEIPNSNIDFRQFDFYVQDKINEWKHKYINGKKIPYIAGLNSFGAGGSNAHIIVQEYMDNETQRLKKENYKANVLVISAQNMKSLVKYCNIYRDFLIESQKINLSFEHIAYASQHDRSVLSVRLAIVACNISEAVNKIEKFVDEPNEKQQGVFLYEEENVIGSQSNLSYDEITMADYSLMEEFALKFVKEGDIDWNKLWNSEKYSHIDLPKYPFERTEYWVEPIDNSNKIVEDASRKGRVVNSSTIFRLQCESRYNKRETFIKDHIVDGKQVLPGAASLLAAKESLGILAKGINVSITDWTFVSKADFETESMTLTTDVSASGAIRVTMMAGNTERVICTGKYHKESAPLKLVDVNISYPKLEYTYTGQKLYNDFKKNHLFYGDTLQRIERVDYSRTTAVVKLNNGVENSTDFTSRMITVLDAAFQGVYVFKDELGLADGEMMLPYKISKFSWGSRTTIPSKILIKKLEDNSFDINLCDDLGQCVYCIYGFEVARVGRLSKNEIDDILDGLKESKYSVESAAKMLERWLENE